LRRFEDDFYECAIHLVGDHSTDVATTAILTALDFVTHPRAAELRGSTQEQDLLFFLVRRLTELHLEDTLGGVVRSELFGTLGLRSLKAVTKVARFESHDDGPSSCFGEKADNIVRLLSFVEIPTNSSSTKHFVDSDSEGDGSGDDDSDGEATSDDEEEEGPRKKKKKKKKNSGKGPKGKKSSKADRMVHSFRRAFENAWLACLKLPMRPQTYKQVLLQLPEAVMPNMLSPLKLSGFLTESYDLGGLSSILALSGLFILMRLHGLDYPQFYDSLYRSLDPSVFHAKHRARFFRLLNLCLSSTSLPTYVVAAFLKRLNRLALGAPPSGALFVLALTKNLLNKHSECMPLISSTSKVNTAAASVDEFDMASPSPSKCGALQSSLWELHAMRSHYHPAVATLCRDIERIWEKREAKLPMDDYVSHTYRELFELETQGKVKAAPLCFRAPSSLFGDGDFLAGVFTPGQP
jgi:U3 small nucleolar RNA-associated protein 19